MLNFPQDLPKISYTNIQTYPHKIFKQPFECLINIKQNQKKQLLPDSKLMQYQFKVYYI